MAAASSFYVRQNQHPELEAAINDQISLELLASYMYMSVACYFDREDVALKHFSLFFLRQSNKEREHAEKLLWLQNQCGGNTCECNAREPDKEDWDSGLRAMEYALRLAKKVNQSLLELYQLATEKNDAHVCNLLKHHCQFEQAMFIKELGDHITNMRKMGTLECSLAENLLDKLTLDDSKN